MENRPRKASWKNLFQWFDPRSNQLGDWAFILNRITAIGLTVYLYMHLIILGKLAQGPDAYDSFLETIKNPIFVTAELLVVAAGFIHGLNGIRVALTSFGIGVPQQKAMFYVLMAIALIATVVIGIRMYTA
jgi:succinate dehydrogenase / fumarate reductase cytochrome b subunit